MKTIYFRDFRKTGDDAYDLRAALEACRDEGAKRLVFDRNTYEINSDRCFERSLNVSNHGWNGPHRIAVLIENMKDLELDFSGSTLVCRGEIMHFAFLFSERITLKNVIIENPQTGCVQARVVSNGDGFTDLEVTHGKEQLQIRRGMPFSVRQGCLIPLLTNVEFNGESGAIERGTADNTLNPSPGELDFEMLSNGLMRVHHVKRCLPIGNYLVFLFTHRFSAGIFCEGCTGLCFKNVTVTSCYGMGLIAQLCKDITLDNFSTKRSGGRMYTANADATHFVECSGEIRVENCSFEGQLDDALNIHGIYTRIVEKSGRELFLKEMHKDARGIRIIGKGDRLSILKPDTLLPYTEITVSDVEYINSDIIRIVANESLENVCAGDNAENISHTASLVFRGNTVRDNRARGMLIAAKGKVLIEDCFFSTSGSAILFEANGEYWFESGGTSSVEIKNCIFKDCRHGLWGNAAIECAPRKAVEPEKYFHREIVITGCSFCGSVTQISLDNLQRAVIKNNTGCKTPVLSHIGSVEADNND